MDIFLPKGFEPGRGRSQMSRPARAGRLCVEAGGVYYPVLRRWPTGFAISADDAPALKGVVILYEGSTRLHQCLIAGYETVGDEVIYKVKQANDVVYSAGAQAEDDTHIFG